MKIEKTASGKYRVRKMISGKTMQRTFDYKPTQKDIDEWLFMERDTLTTHLKAPRTAFSVCADKFIYSKEKVLSASTLTAYKSYLKNLPEDFKNLPIREIDSLTLQALVNDLTGMKSPKTIKNLYSFITAVLGMFSDKRYRVVLPQKEHIEEYIPTAEDVRKVLEACDIEKYRIVFLLGTYGLRRSEILALTPEDVYNDTVHINKAMVLNSDNEWIVQNRNKTYTSMRSVPISHELQEKILNQGYIFKGHPRKINEYLDACQKRAGVPHFRFHALRHFFVTELAQAGFSEADIMALGGYSSPDVMKRVYRHARINNNEDGRRKVVELLESLTNKDTF